MMCQVTQAIQLAEAVREQVRKIKERSAMAAVASRQQRRAQLQLPQQRPLLQFKLKMILDPPHHKGQQRSQQIWRSLCR
jgi:hypothetical protein